MWDFPHFVKAREIYLFIYLFICPRERFACHVVFIWRLVSREDWIPTSVLAQRIVRRPFLFSVVGLYGISYLTYLFPGAFCFQGKDKLFSIFTGSLRALAFQFCWWTRN